MSFSVMAGLVPAIHVVQLARSPNAWPIGRQQEIAVRLDDVDGRDKPGHDGKWTRGERAAAGPWIAFAALAMTVVRNDDCSR
jgi:hypothetical protein